MVPICHFCDSQDVEYCAICKAWLCPTHKKDLALRIKTAIRERLKAIK
jgi:hypothetical protein